MKGQFAFVSYSHEDADLVIPIVETLVQRGFQIWMDRIQLKAGENWSSTIIKVVSDAKVLLWFAGKKTGSSRWMQEELNLALSTNQERIIIPVLVAGAEPERLPLFLQSRHWVDARSDIESALKQLSEALRHHLGFPSAPVEKSTASAKNKGYVFISYSVDDRDFLEELKVFLKRKGYGFWDFHENKRDYQRQFHLELESIIRDSRAVLCIVTPSWKHSRWAPREYLFSEDIRKPIFLLRAKDLEPTLLIAGSSYIDFAGNRSGAFNELERELVAAGL